MLPDTLQQHETAAAIDRDLPGAVAGGHERLGETTLEIEPSRILEVCRYAKDRLGYNRLSAITGVDWHPANPRFEIVYHLHAIRGHRRLRLKCRVGENQPLESVIGVWRSADWYEREVFDMFGVEFRNHPNLSRILMPLDWNGHPLRKDYPVHGYKYSYKDE